MNRFARWMIVFVALGAPSRGVAQDISPDWNCDIKHTELLGVAPDGTSMLLLRRSWQCRDCFYFDHGGLCQAAVYETDLRGEPSRTMELLGFGDLEGLKSSKSPDLHAKGVVQARWKKLPKDLSKKYSVGVIPPRPKPIYKDTWNIGKTRLTLSLRDASDAEGPPGRPTGPRMELVVGDGKRTAMLDWQTPDRARRGLELQQYGEVWSRLLPSSVTWLPEHRLVVRCYSDVQSRGCRADRLSDLRTKLAGTGK